MSFRIAVDLGGTKTEVLLSRDNPLEEIKKIRVSTGQEKGYGFIINQIASLVQDFSKDLPSPPKIGIGIPGTIHEKTGLVKNSNTQCLIGQPLKTDLERLLGQAVMVENDANCFALAEALYGAGQGQGMVLGVIMGTGFGGGIVQNGQIWSGRQGIAGEWGHHSINFQGPPCWCGRRGCVESYLSGTGLERHYQSFGGEKVSLKEIQARFEAGEPLAQKLFENALMWFGEAMANLINCFDPDVIVLGGGVSNLPHWYEQGIEEVKKRLFNEELETPILRHQLGDSAGIYGAALLAR